QRSIRKFTGAQRTLQSRHAQQDSEHPALFIVIDLKRRAWECRADGIMQVFFMANLDDGLKGSRQIAAIVAQYRRSHSDLRVTQRRFVIGAEMVVEAPLVHLRAEGRKLRIKMRFA